MFPGCGAASFHYMPKICWHPIVRVQIHITFSTNYNWFCCYWSLLYSHIVGQRFRNLVSYVLYILSLFPTNSCLICVCCVVYRNVCYIIVDVCNTAIKCCADIHLFYVSRKETGSLLCQCVEKLVKWDANTQYSIFILMIFVELTIHEQSIVLVVLNK